MSLGESGWLRILVRNKVLKIDPGASSVYVRQAPVLGLDKKKGCKRSNIRFSLYDQVTLFYLLTIMSLKTEQGAQTSVSH